MKVVAIITYGGKVYAPIAYRQPLKDETYLSVDGTVKVSSDDFPLSDKRTILQAAMPFSNVPFRNRHKEYFNDDHQ